MEAETKTIPEHGEHFNESIVNEVILEDMNLPPVLFWDQVNFHWIW